MDSLPLFTPAEAWERVRCLQALYHCSVTSNGRTEQRNTAVGGVETSFHLIERACVGWDLSPDDLTLSDQVASAARKLGFEAIVYPGHVHLEPPPSSPLASFG